MAMPAWIPEAWSKLSEEQQKEAGDFLRLLLDSSKDKNLRNPDHRGFPFGILKGKIRVADNFDDPLPGLEEYM